LVALHSNSDGDVRLLEHSQTADQLEGDIIVLLYPSPSLQVQSHNRASVVRVCTSLRLPSSECNKEELLPLQASFILQDLKELHLQTYTSCALSEGSLHIVLSIACVNDAVAEAVVYSFFMQESLRKAILLSLSSSKEVFPLHNAVVPIISTAVGYKQHNDNIVNAQHTVVVVRHIESLNSS